MMGSLKELLAGWSDKTVTEGRIKALLDRGSSLALAMEKWTRSGLWVITRSDPEYPAWIKKKLGPDSPPVFFGCGNKSLLNRGGLAVVGSRNTVDSDFEFSRGLGKLAAERGSSIISGGARGVDEAAMLGSLEAEGNAIGVLADSLMKATCSGKYRPHLMANNLVLISPFYPEAGFNVGNAMQRNKYIYCLATAAVVVHSGLKGGTWSGAHENLKNRWVPLWVKKSTDTDAGNDSIVRDGGRWLPNDLQPLDFDRLMAANESVVGTADIFSPSVSEPEPSPSPKTADCTEPYHEPEIPKEKFGKTDRTQSENTVTNTRSSEDVLLISFYEYFLLKLELELKEKPAGTEELMASFELNKTQLNTWLKRAVDEGMINKLAKPVRYEWNNSQQHPLFD